PPRACDDSKLGAGFGLRRFVLLGRLVLPGVLAAEALHAAGRIQQLLLAGEERVAVGADFEGMIAHGGAGLDHVPAPGNAAAPLVVGVNSGLHGSGTPADWNPGLWPEDTIRFDSPAAVSRSGSDCGPAARPAGDAWLPGGCPGAAQYTTLDAARGERLRPA